MLKFLRGLSRKKPDAATPSSVLWSLQSSLFKLSKKDAFTIGNAVDNVLIVGGIGSGKTSGSGRTLATSYLSAGFGALVLCVKPEEPELFRQYCALAGRSDDLIEFGPQNDWRFDPLAFELSRAGGGWPHREPCANVLYAVGPGRKGWRPRRREGGRTILRKAVLQLLRNLVDLIVLATGNISVPDLYRLAVSTASSLEQVRSEEWRYPLVLLPLPD